MRFQMMQAEIPDGMRLEPLSHELKVEDAAHKYMQGVEYGNLLAYLIRRFGYTKCGSDDHKEICAYLLNTPREDVFIRVGVRAGREVWWDFSAYVSNATWLEYIGARQDGKGQEFLKDHVKAVARAVKELQRPVYVRDVPISPLGRLTEDAARKVRLVACEAHESAGYGAVSRYYKQLLR
ncbi:hypothetical protein [Deinococcus misasensis]|uniref:hypothetical protein n=1 Tax=Deinococcus misasensis TaxID=392413 RepID=UPI00054CE93D|nr:hypothetical protein [Deinococcus misasensis]